jgi:acyl-CoA thioester hydrolase
VVNPHERGSRQTRTGCGGAPQAAGTARNQNQNATFAHESAKLVCNLSDRLTQSQIRRIICMLDRTDLEPVFFAPFVSSVMRVDPAWIDFNGHLNMAYYNVLFDRAVDEAFELVGVGPSYVQRRRRSFFTAEVHLRYLRELHLGDPVRVTLQLLDYDRKRLHFFEQLFHATDGWVSATSENLSLHVDLEAKKAVAFSDAVADRLALMKAAHAMLPRPEVAGRSIEMPDGS